MNKPVTESLIDSRNQEWNSFDEIEDAFIEAAELGKFETADYLNEVMDQWIEREFWKVTGKVISMQEVKDVRTVLILVRP